MGSQLWLTECSSSLELLLKESNKYWTLLRYKEREELQYELKQLQCDLSTKKTNFY